ncbi:MAG TPA: hypothetical protein VG406_13775 [Isosphaeraceae bacterium]|jgi:hypothetical protein|nr:hypothetical protein [Isosphaeraceae bacterium]
MAIGFVDLLMAHLATPANQGPFLDAVGLAAFAGTSFARRYGQGGFQVDGVTLGAPGGLRFQEWIQDDAHLVGTREQRGERPDRQAYDFRFRAPEPGWVDAAFSLPAQFALHAVPGSLTLGPGADVVPAGVASTGKSGGYGLKFLATLGTDAFSLSYVLNTYLFASAELSPRDDLRRVLTLRRTLEASPSFLASLDGPPDQRPYLFVQVYPAGAAGGAAPGQAGVAQLFDAADMLAAFFDIPAV